MTNEKATLKDLLVGSIGEEGRCLRDHPTTEKLVEFRGGNLSQDQENTVLEHLGICRECADSLLDFAACCEEPPRAIEVESMAGESADPSVFSDVWGRIRDRLWPDGGMFRGRVLQGLACATVLALVVFSMFQWQRASDLRSRWQEAREAVAELSQPQLNMKILPIRRVVRDVGPQFWLLDLGADDRRFLMFFPVSGKYESYQLRILGADGREVSKFEGLQPDELGLQVHLELSREFLKPGDYVFEVSGLKDGEPESADEHRVRLLYS
jgi:hypothetical protein